MLENIIDFIERRPIVIVLLIAYLLSPIPLSVLKWREHLQNFVCEKEVNKCYFKTYSYKHNICWDSLISSRYTRMHYGYCRLPQYKTSSTELLSLTEIENIIYQNKNNKHKVYMIGKNGQRVFITDFKNADSAKYHASHINARIKKWQEPLNYDSEMDYGPTIYEYKFIK